MTVSYDIGRAATETSRWKALGDEVGYIATQHHLVFQAYSPPYVRYVPHKHIEVHTTRHGNRAANALDRAKSVIDAMQGVADYNQDLACAAVSADARTAMRSSIPEDARKAQWGMEIGWYLRHVIGADPNSSLLQQEYQHLEALVIDAPPPPRQRGIGLLTGRVAVPAGKKFRSQAFEDFWDQFESVPLPKDVQLGLVGPVAISS